MPSPVFKPVNPVGCLFQEARAFTRTFGVSRASESKTSVATTFGKRYAAQKCAFLLGVGGFCNYRGGNRGVESLKYSQPVAEISATGCQKICRARACVFPGRRMPFARVCSRTVLNFKFFGCSSKHLNPAVNFLTRSRLIV